VVTLAGYYFFFFLKRGYVLTVTKSSQSLLTEINFFQQRSHRLKNDLERANGAVAPNICVRPQIVLKTRHETGGEYPELLSRLITDIYH